MDGRTTTRGILLLGAVAALACGGGGDGPGPVDGGPPPADAGGPGTDGGGVDATPPPADTGAAPDTGPRDTGTPPVDTGPPGSGCGADPGSRDRELSITHDGLTRTFQVHLPTGYDRDTPTPVVLNFHGRTSTSTQQAFLSGMNAVADAEGFLAVHPDGVGRAWNVGFCCDEAMSRDVDDVGFTEAMIDALEATYCVDPSRVYATGLSNGGFLAHQLGCELSDRIAAIAAVAGTNVTSSCNPGRGVPVMHFHGTADAVVYYDGYAGGFGSVASTIDGWVARNGCGATGSVYLTTTDVTCEEWTGCDDGATVRLCTVEGGGHQWPGGFTLPGFGYNTDEIDATDALWAFFEAHHLGT